ncbi:MAG: ABC transporter permease [Deltaproteobacteria bacterium]|nr:ABC transporter permease [Deltaproteobacteria bacterium]
MVEFFFEKFGKVVTDFLEFLGGLGRLSAKTFKDMFHSPQYIQLTLNQIQSIGNESLPLVVVTCLSTGMVIALQFAYGLEKFGGQLYVPKVIALSFIRELGPVFTSLMVCARVGAGIAAEVGSMNVTEQIDAIRALGTSPIKKIVIPRISATLIALPILTVFGILIGLIGGMIICYTELNLTPQFYYNKITETIILKDFFAGMGKTFFFAIIISMIGCYKGLTTKGGTQGVGISTTQSVVLGTISILIADFFLTKLFMEL